MTRSNNFPNVEEFRARAAKLGFTTGAPPGQLGLPREEKPHRADARPLVLWGVLGMVSVSLLGWMVLEQGGVNRFADALGVENPSFLASSPGNSALNTQTGISDIELREIAALRDRLGKLERRRLAAAQAPDNQEPPVQTGSLPAPRLLAPSPVRQTAPKQNALKKSSGRAPTSVVVLPLANGAVERSRLARRIQFGLDLGGYATLPDLAKKWAKVLAGNGDLLAGLAPRQVTEFSANGAKAFRLIAGPVAKIADAVQLCAIFRSRGISCRQTISAGEPL
ncbi:MAG: hypothetical protein ACTSY1_01705 [Alphaproteobacteria bacterium]